MASIARHDGHEGVYIACDRRLRLSRVDWFVDGVHRLFDRIHAGKNGQCRATGRADWGRFTACGLCDLGHSSYLELTLALARTGWEK